MLVLARQSGSKGVGGGNVPQNARAGRDTPPRCQANGVWLACTARRGERRRISRSLLAALSCAATDAMTMMLAMPLPGAASATARRLLTGRQEQDVNELTMQPPGGSGDGARGDVPRRRGVERAAHYDAVALNDEPCSARRRAQARGWQTCGHDEPSRPNARLCTCGPLHLPRRFAPATRDA